MKLEWRSSVRTSIQSVWVCACMCVGYCLKDSLFSQRAAWVPLSELVAPLTFSGLSSVLLADGHKEADDLFNLSIYGFNKSPPLWGCCACFHSTLTNLSITFSSDLLTLRYLEVLLLFFRMWLHHYITQTLLSYVVNCVHTRFTVCITKFQNKDKTSQSVCFFLKISLIITCH